MDLKPVCHPDRKLACKGLCWTCYHRSRNRVYVNLYDRDINLYDVANVTGISAAEANTILKIVLGTITKALRRGEEVHIRGLGWFRVRDYTDKEQAVMRRWAKGKKVPTKRVLFRPSKSIVRTLNKEN